MTSVKFLVYVDSMHSSVLSLAIKLVYEHKWCFNWFVAQRFDLLFEKGARVLLYHLLSWDFSSSVENEGTPSASKKSRASALVARGL